MANLFGIPEQHMENWGDALISKNPPWTTTPEYHQWGAQDVTQEKSKEIAQDYGNLAAGAFELGAPFMALGASPIYDTAQAISKYNQEPGKYEVNNKWDKINAYFPDLEGTTVSGILNAIDIINYSVTVMNQRYTDYQVNIDENINQIWIQAKLLFRPINWF